uniref:Uncharacterized protein n=1 Tax=Sphaerodactylus townsendi TaxID=933632 RepID=A0ACB8GBR1_9SAUR
MAAGVQKGVAVLLVQTFYLLLQREGPAVGLDQLDLVKERVHPGKATLETSVTVLSELDAMIPGAEQSVLMQYRGVEMLLENDSTYNALAPIDE